MSKKSTITLRVPHELKDKIAQVAESQGVSINQFAMYLFTKEVTRLEIEWKKLEDKYIGNKTEEEIENNFRKVLKKVKPSKKLPEWDKVK